MNLKLNSIPLLFVAHASVATLEHLKHCIELQYTVFFSPQECKTRHFTYNMPLSRDYQEH